MPRKRLCIDDLTLEQVEEMMRQAAATGGKIVIDIMPAVNRRMKAAKPKRKRS